MTSLGTSLGGKPAAGTSLGSQPKAGTALGGTALGGTALGGQPKNAGTALGGTALGGTALGGQPKNTGTALGGTALGGNQTKNPPAPKAKNPPAPKPTPQATQPEAKSTETPEVSKPETGDKPAQPAAKKAAEKKPAPAKGGKPAPKVAAPPKAIQLQLQKRAEEEAKRKAEAEKRRQEAILEKERQKKLDEEAEKQRIIRDEQREKAKAANKIKQEADDLEKRRLDAIAKYGYAPDSLSSRGRGGDRGRGGRGGRGGKGGRGGGRGGSNDSSLHASQDSQQSESSEPSKPVKTVQPTETKPTDASAGSEDDWEAWGDKDAPASTPAQDVPDDIDALLDAEDEPEPAKAEQPKPKAAEPAKVEESKTETPAPESEENTTSKAKTREAEMQSRKEEAAAAKKEALEEQQSKLRSPICCVLGHVDTGKTLLLDKIRQSNVQAGEAGGITQQIGATFFPMENIRMKTKRLDSTLKNKLTYKVPGLLIIDTPGHESFTNLRSRGSSLCDIAVLVVDLVHGLEPQTRESITLLKQKKTPFVVALNKVDRLFMWKETKDAPIKESFKKQEKNTMMEFEDRVKGIITEFAEVGLNACLYYNNKDYARNVSLIPTSAITGEGIPDLLLLLIQLSQKLMSDKLLKISRLECTVLEVKKLHGRGTTLDVILANGELNKGDQICVCSFKGEPIITNIRALLTPPPMAELRVKSEYISHDKIRAAMGCKVDAPGLDEAVAGSPLFVIKPTDSEQTINDYKAAVQKSLNYLKGKVDKSGVGVYVQTSTLGSMEALLEFLSTDEVSIPVSGIRIGPVHKKDVIKASIMLEHQKEYAVILAFDVVITKEARDHAAVLGVRIFEAEIIYHLFDSFSAYVKEFRDKEKGAAAEVAVFPCVLSIFPEYVFHKSSPIVLGVHVVEGILKKGTPICIPSKDKLEIGIVIGIEKDHNPMEEAKQGEDVCIEILQPQEKQQYMFGRHFDHNDHLVSRLSRESMAALVKFYPEVCQVKANYMLLKKLKKLFY